MILIVDALGPTSVNCESAFYIPGHTSESQSGDKIVTQAPAEGPGGYLMYPDHLLHKGFAGRQAFQSFLLYLGNLHLFSEPQGLYLFLIN